MTDEQGVSKRLLAYDHEIKAMVLERPDPKIAWEQGSRSAKEAGLKRLPITPRPRK